MPSSARTRRGFDLGFLSLYFWNCLASVPRQCLPPEHSTREEHGACLGYVWWILWVAPEEAVGLGTHQTPGEANWRCFGQGILLKHLWPRGRSSKILQGARTGHPVQHRNQWLPWHCSQPCWWRGISSIFLVSTYILGPSGYCDRPRHTW